MKWHRILFWSVFVLFFAATIGFEGGRLHKDGIIKFGLFGGITCGSIFVLEIIFVRFHFYKQYFQFFLAVCTTVILAVILEIIAESTLFGPHPIGWGFKLKESSAFMASWMAIAVCLFIAEDIGKAALQKTSAELEYLKSQINPHFLLNTHNNIYFLIEQNPQLASEMLLKLSGMMQYMLYECSTDKVPIEREFTYLKNYIELEEIRKNKNILIEYNFSDQTNGAQLAPLLLISFVENAFKHVSNFREHQNFIRIKALIENNSLDFVVINTKSAERIVSEKGIGLKNVKQRLDLLYKRKYTLHIKNDKNQHEIHLHINLN